MDPDDAPNRYRYWALLVVDIDSKLTSTCAVGSIGGLYVSVIHGRSPVGLFVPLPGK